MTISPPPPPLPLTPSVVPTSSLPEDQKEPERIHHQSFGVVEEAHRLLPNSTEQHVETSQLESAGPASQQERSSSFQEVVTNVLIETEEFRRKLKALGEYASSCSSSNSSLGIQDMDCFAIQRDMEALMNRLYVLIPSNDVEREMRRHCQLKTADVALFALTILTKYKSEPDPDDPENDEDSPYDADLQRQCQAVVARIAELNLVLLEPEPDGDNKNNREQTILDIYSSYQKQVLRKRVKPSIARLVDYRKRQEDHIKSNGFHHGQLHSDDDDEDCDDNDVAKSQHVRVVTTILGQASALIHPLMMWQANLPPHMKAMKELCSRSIQLVDEQAQTMTKTVGNWFLSDSKIDSYWMNMSACEESCLHQLGDLDGVVEQLAFCCQVFDRYIELVNPARGENVNNADDSKVILKKMHDEWTWKYASMERYLTTQQLQSALQMANPVQIVIGTPLQVPSVVEDAQYLSTRALKRAASTRSNQAIGTVAHSIASDVWSTDMANGVHEALVEQRGCYDENSSIQDKTSTNSGQALSPSRGPNSGSSSFAAALMDALDDDLGDERVKKRHITSPPMTPSSGGFLGSLSTSLASVSGGDRFLQMRLDTFLCAMNGFHSASTACTSLVEFLDSLLPSDEEDDHHEFVNKSNSQSMTMTHLAREELFRFSSNYLKMLDEQATRVVCEFCGTPQDAPAFKGDAFLPVIRYYLEREDYNLSNSQELAAAEDDARLHKILSQPMLECRLLQQLEKCDSDVLASLCEKLASMISDMFLDVLLSQTVPKRVTEWGSLLLSTEVRMVQNILQKMMQKAASTYHGESVPALTAQWERLSQAVTILQLEKPSDLSFYQSSSVFSWQELHALLSLRIEFSPDAVGAVIAGFSSEARK